MTWEKVKLGEVLAQIKVPVEIDNSKEYKLVTVSNKGTIRLREIIKGNSISADKAFLAKKQKFIYSRLSVHNGAFGLIPDELDNSIVTSEMPLFDFDKKLLPQYLIYALRLPSFQFQLEFLTKGMGRTRVKEKDFLQLEISLPPLEEQKQLIKKIETIEQTNSTLTTELTLQLDIVKQLRQSFLREAMQGKLVDQDINDEPAIELLKKIKVALRQAQGDRKGKKQKELPPIKEDEIPFEIPVNWVWCRLAEIAKSVSTGPFGTMLHKSDYVNNGIPVVNPMNIVDGEIVSSEKMNVSQETKSRLKSYVLEKGDIVIGRRGEMGRCAVVTEKEDGWLCGTGSFFVKLYDWVDRYFFVKVLSSEYSKKSLLGSSVGATMNNLNHRILYNLLIPLPPLPEQHRIVAKLEKLMQLCDELEQSIRQSKEQTTMLVQAALREALQPNAKVVKLPVLQEPEKQAQFKRAVLAAYIINQSLDDPNFGNTKFEKLLHLAEYHAIKRNFNQNYLQQAAGPYDNKFTYWFWHHIEKQKWFRRQKQGAQFFFKPGSAHQKSTNIYNYFSNEELEQVKKLIRYFKTSDYQTPEIASTLYAVWNNRIILQQEINDDLLIEDFYGWDEDKKKYKHARLENALQWMRKEGLVPVGWGKAVLKAEGKKSNALDS